MRTQLIPTLLAILATLVASAAPPTPLDSVPVAESVATSNGKTLGAAHFEINMDTKSLIVTTDPETNETIGRLIAQLDKPVPQALIKVLFLEVTHGDGIDVGTSITYEHADTGETADSIVDKQIVQGLLGAGSFTSGGIVQILEDDLDVTLAALAEVSRLEVLSRPSIMAQNNQEATITVGSEVPFITNSQTTDEGTTLNTIEYEDIGIILKVTPYIAEDGTVEMDVAPEISTIAAETVQISEKVEAATYNKRTAETRVTVPSGKTVVIGGMMETQETETVSKIPLLGDIWFLGALFRHKKVSKSKTELLIFLTPTVVRSEKEALDLTDAEKATMKLKPTVVSPEELKGWFKGK